MKCSIASESACLWNMKNSGSGGSEGVSRWLPHREEARDVVRGDVVQRLSMKSMDKGAELNTLGHWQPVELLKKRGGMNAFVFF